MCLIPVCSRSEDGVLLNLGTRTTSKKFCEPCLPTCVLLLSSLCLSAQTPKTPVLTSSRWEEQKLKVFIGFICQCFTHLSKAIPKGTSADLYKISSNRSIFLTASSRTGFICYSWTNSFVIATVLVYLLSNEFIPFVGCHKTMGGGKRKKWDLRQVSALACMLELPACRLMQKLAKWKQKGWFWAYTEAERSHRLFLLTLGGSDQPGTTFTWLLPQQNCKWKGIVYSVRLVLVMKVCMQGCTVI